MTHYGRPPPISVNGAYKTCASTVVCQTQRYCKSTILFSCRNYAGSWYISDLYLVIIIKVKIRYNEMKCLIIIFNYYVYGFIKEILIMVY